MSLVCLAAPGAEPALVPFTVCEILHDKPAYEGKAIAVLGRYSFRQDGRWIAEQACESPSPDPPLLWLTEDAKDGPRPPNDFELDGAAVNRKLGDIRKRTSLQKFRFGTPDYDRWAVVYGRIENRPGDPARKAAAELVFRGDGVVVFLNP